MSKNQVYDEISVISLPVPAGTKSGDPVKVGNFVGVADTDVQDDSHATTYPISRGGVGNPNGYASVNIDPECAYLVDCADAVTGPGTPVYITGAGPFTITTTAAGNTRFGTTLPGPGNAYASKAAGAGKVLVKLIGTV